MILFKPFNWLFKVIPNGRINVNDELERTCKEMVVTYSKILHPKVPDKAEGNNEIPKSRQSAFEHRRC
jgi:MOSC domain-containing protein YiiM